MLHVCVQIWLHVSLIDESLHLSLCVSIPSHSVVGGKLKGNWSAFVGIIGEFLAGLLHGTPGSVIS